MDPTGELGIGMDAAWFARDRLGFQPDRHQSEILRSNAKRVILNCTRQWGKSTVTAAKAVHTALYQEGSLTLVISPTQRQSAELVRKAGGFLRRLGLRTRGDGDNEVSLALGNGSRIVGLPGMEYSVRGFSSAALLLVDEAARVGEELYQAMRPVLAVSNGAVWMMSTPFGRQGFFHDTWTEGGPEWTRVRVPATECPRIPASFLEEERRTMPESVFRREYLCEFEENESSAFDDELLKRALDYDIEPIFFDR